MTDVMRDDVAVPEPGTTAPPGRVPRSVMVVIGVASAYLLGYAIWCVTTQGSPEIPFRLIAGSDSSKYLDDARAPLWSGDLYTGAGPFGIYLLLKLCQYNPRAFVLVQSGIAAAAWATLTLTVVRRLASRVTRVAAAVVVMGLAVAPPVIVWNSALSTESSSLSTMVLFVAASIGLVTVPTRRSAAWFGVATLVFVTVRDVNAATVAIVGLVLLVLGIARADGRRVVAWCGLAALVLSFGALVLANQADPPRWYHPVGETILLRIRTAPDGQEFLAEEGMPQHESFASFDSGVEAYFLIGTDWSTEPEYADFREWLLDDGRGVLVRYLRAHPGWVVSSAWDARGALLAPTVEGYAFYARSWPPWPLRFGYLVYFPTPTTLYAAGLVVVGLSVAARRRRPLGRLWAVGGATMVLGLVYVAATFHGDALELDRHGLTGAVQIRVGLWLMALVALDHWVAGRPAPPGEAAAAPPGPAPETPPGEPGVPGPG